MIFAGPFSVPHWGTETGNPVRIVYDLTGLSGDDVGLARFSKLFLEVVVAHNRYLMRQARRAGRAVPPLYRSGIRFRPMPWAGQVEQFASCATLLRRGWADCDQLCAYRIAELRERGIGATFRFYWRKGKRGRLYHVQVRHPPCRRHKRGKIEDPTQRLNF